MSTTHVLGMAKSSLDLKGAKQQKLELDYLRLVYACQYLQARGGTVYGYVAVTSVAIERQMAKWAVKYLVPSAFVQVVVAPLSDPERAFLLAEKDRNRLGNLVKADAADPVKAADGSYGRDLLEQALGAHILSIHPAVRQAGRGGNLPMGVRWDYYGTY